LVTHLFSIAVPYIPPTAQFLPADLISLAVPTLAYQKQLSSGIVEEKIKTKDEIRNFINTMYGGTTPDGQPGFSLYKGLLFDRVSSVRQSPLLSTEVTTNMYIGVTVANILSGPRVLHYRICAAWAERAL
jgi:hypothetical protein